VRITTGENNVFTEQYRARSRCDALAYMERTNVSKGFRTILADGAMPSFSQDLLSCFPLWQIVVCIWTEMFVSQILLFDLLVRLVKACSKNELDSCRTRGKG
jgi:hypothetical protein